MSCELEDGDGPGPLAFYRGDHVHAEIVETEGFEPRRTDHVANGWSET